jgi:hypothetical protein
VGVCEAPRDGDRPTDQHALTVDRGTLPM